jgi:DNA-binding NarL/FixJ family response regulator
MATETLAVAVCSPQEVVETGLLTLLGKHPGRFRLVPPPDGPEHEDPDIVLYDVIALQDGDTTELTYLVERTRARVLAIGRDLRPDLASRALAAGADGYFSMGVDEDELVAAVLAAGEGCDPGPSPVDPGRPASVASRLGAELGLTDRESDVLALIAQGRSNQEIADRLYVSINSVKTYIRTAYRKIDVVSRAQAVNWAIRHGFPPEPDDLGRPRPEP